jgi:hypothetical protein
VSASTKTSDTHKERYYHVPLLPASIQFRKPMKMATVFARLEDDGTWHAAVGFCSMRDQFSRRIGRQNARRQYFQGRRPTARLTPRPGEPDYPTFEDARRLAEHLASML